MATRLRSALLALVLPLAIGSCAGSVASSGTPAPTSSHSAPSPSPTETSSSFSLLLWSSNGSISPASYLPGVMPELAIEGNLVLDGLVAVPAIYPGPLYTAPVSRTISANGQAQVIALLRQDGLLTNLDLATPATPGAAVLHLRVTQNGATYDTSGYSSPLEDCATRALCSFDPGTPRAFADAVAQLFSLDGWLSGELGTSSQYSPSELAVRLTAPLQAPAPMTPTTLAWPLTVSFTDLEAAGLYDCVTLGASDTARLLPTLLSANILTRFIDSSNAVRSLQVRALFPGEDAPCPLLTTS